MHGRSRIDIGRSLPHSSHSTPSPLAITAGPGQDMDRPRSRTHQGGYGHSLFDEFI